MDIQLLAVPYDSGNRGARMGAGPEKLLDAGLERILRESRDCDCVTLESCAFLRDEGAKPPPGRRRIMRA